MCSYQQLTGNLSADSLRIVALSSTPDGTDVVLRIKPFTSMGTCSLGSSNTLAVFRRYLPTTIASFACTGAGTSGTLSCVTKRPRAPWLERLPSRPMCCPPRVWPSLREGLLIYTFEKCRAHLQLLAHSYPFTHIAQQPLLPKIQVYAEGEIQQLNIEIIQWLDAYGEGSGIRNAEIAQQPHQQNAPFAVQKTRV